MSSNQVLKIDLQKDYGPKVRIQFKDTDSRTDIDQVILHSLSIKNNERYSLSYIDEDNKSVCVYPDGSDLAQCVLTGIKLLNVVTEENTSSRL